MRTTIGRYQIQRELGSGAMGVVYAAHDEDLGRTIALKMIRDGAASEEARARLWREARAAAAINHPNVCQVYEIGEAEGALYIAMELLAGEPLAARIARGAVPIGEALTVLLGVLAALEALHRRDIVHRDLKPSNVFLTEHGVKLLDFGLARPLAREDAARDLTMPGALIGTPRYMAPEMWSGDEITPAADLFAAGAILFEMLAGRPAFGGHTLLEIGHAIQREHPPALTGEAAVVAADRVIHRALAKRPADRFSAAAAMADDVRAALVLLESPAARVIRTTRLIVLPFRLLRPDPEIDFLALSLADAITASLAQVETLVVRSSLAAARFAGVEFDLKAIVAEVDVDLVLAGTLLRSGDQVRVNAQLVEAPSGTLVWSVNAQVLLGDIFQLQDDLAHRIVDSLSLPLAARGDQAWKRDVPATPRAYELYLRANHLGWDVANASVLATARDLYRQCLAEDPAYAPAWARLGRTYRVMAKFGHEDSTECVRLAEEAFSKAFALNPDLPIAHNLYTYFEIDELARPRQAMVRLLERARTRPNDPELFAGLVFACRICGLLEASLAADRTARRLDPAIRTSVHYTHLMLGDYVKAIERDDDPIRDVSISALTLLGRRDEALAICRELASRGVEGSERWFVESVTAFLEGRPGDCAAAMANLKDTPFRDPEGLFFNASLVAAAGAERLALDLLGRAVANGFASSYALAHDPGFDSLRANPEFLALFRRVEAAHSEAAAAFEGAGGERLLGVQERR
jgi:TolB-like protein